ncbi:hypothetical protein FF1_000503 [Malus domestica]|uniref:uncharacterized protein n=1 Tax=Malus domestica TaxID=3750 RepID=UPI0010AA2827|nr:probable rhamnogalacturonate lyase B [Malus domestica]XP_028944754.1 probable rhamnogalacturonate lyase B [Malus domestica]
MEKVRQWSWVLGILGMLALLFFLPDDGNFAKISVRRALRSVTGSNNGLDQMLIKTKNQVVMDNGIVRLTFSYPGGDVIGIKYKGIDNLLEIKNQENNRGYWDVVWNNKETGGIDKLQGRRFKIITARADQTEISFTKTYDISRGNATLSMNVDKRYIMQRGRAGFYAYSIFERPKGWPGLDIDQIRIVYKLQQDKFQFMAVSDDRQRVMPTADDRSNGIKLAYPEAVLLTNPSNPDLRGEVDDKYQYSSEDKDNKVHGWICTKPAVGFWIITPSDEFRTAGPFKQDLTSHVGPTALSMFVSTHYAGKEVGMRFARGEAWKKVFGPVFVYLNSVPSLNESALWENAKEQLVEEVKSWPYSFTQSEDIPSSSGRGSVAGQLLVRDRYTSKSLVWASSAYVGLAAPGKAGSWQKESKGYQFWTQANEQGHFLIKDVRPGNYSLYATVPGIIGDYKFKSNITIEPGSEINLANLTYVPPRNGPTLWEIGIPDRSAAEFYVPDPNPTLMNKLFTTNRAHKFRQYGLWERYADLYPDEDLIYNIGTDNYSDNWFFAHVTRNIGNRTYEATTWRILFELQDLTNTGNYTLQLALASATNAEVQVRFNDQSAFPPHFTTGLIGKDNAIARHGIHGLYWLFSIGVPSYRLREGNNTIYLTQSRSLGTFEGVMYDYIRLEGPPPRK